MSRSVERKTRGTVERREKPLGVSQDEELEYLCARTPGERVLQPEQTDADDFGSPGLRIAGFGQKIDESIDPVIS